MVLHAQRSKSGLDLEPPRSGRGADAYAVAQTAVMLRTRAVADPGTKETPWPGLCAARHATALHMLSGRIHRIHERQCNEDLHCGHCSGEGYLQEGNAVVPLPQHRPCYHCAGTGSTVGRTLARLERQALDIAEHYRCRLHVADGGLAGLYLIPCEAQDAAKDESNPNIGHAVARMGR
jgi:hypothetical protein